MTFRYPLDTVKITQNFGDRPEYYAQFGQKGHNGVDLGIPVGTPVYASENGTVFYEGQGINQPWMGSIAGIVVIIDHGSVYTGYAHLKDTVVNRGQVVTKGQLIGHTGITGVSSGPHLHFEFIGKPVNIKNGYYGRVNPDQYLKGDTEMIIGSGENWYWRFNRFHHQLVRNGDLPREVFNSIVGQDAWKVLESWSDHPEADQLLQDQVLGELARKDGWQDQIYNGLDKIAVLEQERNAARDEATALKAQLLTATAQIEELKAQLALAGDDTQHLNALGEALRWFIARVGIKK